jgi:hypothetical protein
MLKGELSNSHILCHELKVRVFMQENSNQQLLKEYQ